MKHMRRILINDKNEFSYSEVKISERHQVVKQIGRLFESRGTIDRTGVIVSNTAKPPDKK